MVCSLVLHFEGGAGQRRELRQEKEHRVTAKEEGVPGTGAKVSERYGKSNECQLVSTVFLPSANARELCCVRGKTAGAFDGYGSFQWTRAVQGISILVVRTVLAQHSAKYIALLQGERGSLAAALDFAISKQPGWLVDMFGLQIHGRPVSQSLFARTNTHLKRPGPVVLSINQRWLPAHSIQLQWNGQPVTHTEHIENLLAALANPIAVNNRSP
jgi:type IV secretory pathway TrbD component